MSCRVGCRVVGYKEYIPEAEGCTEMSSMDLWANQAAFCHGRAKLRDVDKIDHVQRRSNSGSE